MKILIDKKVWDLPNDELTDVRDMMVQRQWAEAEYDFAFNVPSTCCTKRLIKYLENAYNKREIVKVVVLFGTTQEVKFKFKLRGFTMSMLDEIFKYECVVLGGVKTKQLIDWENVENEN